MARQNIFVLYCIATIHDVIPDHQLDFLALSETWIRMDTAGGIVI